MHLYQRDPKNGIWWVGLQAPDGRYLRESTGCTDKRAAEMYGAERERQLQNPAYAAQASTTLRDAVDETLTHKKVAKKRAASTVQRSTYSGAHLLRVMGDLTGHPAQNGPPLSRVDAALVDQYCAARLEEGSSRHTIYKELCFLREVLALMYRRKRYTESPEVVVPEWEKEHTPRKRHLTVDEATRLLAVMAPDRAAHISFILGTGARWNESCAARRSDVDFDNNLVIIRGTKTVRSRGEVKVPIVSILRPWLHRALEDAPTDEPLFRPWSAYWRDIQAACDRAKIEFATPNDMRRTAATWLGEAGVPPFLIASVLRNTEEVVREVYDRTGAEARRKAIEAIIQVQQGGRSMPHPGPESCVVNEQPQGDTDGQEGVQPDGECMENPGGKPI